MLSYWDWDFVTRCDHRPSGQKVSKALALAELAATPLDLPVRADTSSRSVAEHETERVGLRGVLALFCR